MIDDIKRSIIENIRARLPDIDADAFYPDPPPNEHDRPCFYLTFVSDKLSREQRMGSRLRDYTFEAVIEVLESNERPASETETEIEQKFRLMKAAFTEGEMLTFYHFVNGSGTARSGQMKVARFIIEENKKDREKNIIRAQLIITF